MNSNANPNWKARKMLQLKGPYEAEDIQGHLGNVDCMPIAISLGQTTSHHVGITNGFHLWKYFLISESAPSKGTERGGGEQRGEMAQTIYAHMNK
jgi:hypothetical protein